MNTNAQIAKAENMAYGGFRQVSRDEFFATVGKMDVTPYPQGRWSNEIGYLSHWKNRYGAVVGLSDDYNGGKHPVSGVGRYWVQV